MQPDDANVTDSLSLRKQLMAPHPMQRAMALHALEREAERNPAAGLAGEVGRFTARGIPYYALHDPHFQQWVGKAVSYWEKLQAGLLLARPVGHERSAVAHRDAR